MTSRSELLPWAVVAVIRRGTKVLAVWNRRYKGWTLPGGLVEPNETEREALARELEEETGLEIESARLRSFAKAPPSPPGGPGDRASHVAVFEVEPRGEPMQGEPGAPVRWIERDDFVRTSPFGDFYAGMQL